MLLMNKKDEILFGPPVILSQHRKPDHPYAVPVRLRHNYETICAYFYDPVILLFGWLENDVTLAQTADDV